MVSKYDMRLLSYSIIHVITCTYHLVNNCRLAVFVIVRVHLSVSSRLRGIRARAQREPMTS